MFKHTDPVSNQRRLRCRVLFISLKKVQVAKRVDLADMSGVQTLEKEAFLTIDSVTRKEDQPEITIYRRRRKLCAVLSHIVPSQLKLR